MVGRKAMGNPFIFEEIDYALKGKLEEYQPPTPKEKLATARMHLELVGKYIGGISAIKEMRKHLVAYTKGMVKATELRNAIFKMTNEEEIITLLQEYESKYYGL